MKPISITISKESDHIGPYYLVDYSIYVLEDGERKRKRKREKIRGPKREAELRRTEIQIEFGTRKNSLTDNEIPVKNLSDLIQEFLDSKNIAIRRSSLVRYGNYYAPFAEFIKKHFRIAYYDISQIKTIYIREFMSHMERGKLKWKKTTINNSRQKLSALFNYALRVKYINTNPVLNTEKIRVSQKNKIEYFSDDELTRLWENVDDFWIDHFQFLLYTGLRKGELINLKWANVNLNDNTRSITIISDEQWETKTGRHRTINLHNKAIIILEKWKDKHAEYVFTNTKGNKMGQNDAYNALQKGLKKAGLKGDLHMFRHTFSSRYLMAGGSLTALSRILGHSSIKTSMIYVHFSPEYMEDKINLIK